MRRTLRLIARDRKLELIVAVIGMHWVASRGSTIGEIEADGFAVERLRGPVRASPDAFEEARRAGMWMERLAKLYRKLKPDLVMLVGDRPEIFAAAGAAQVAGILVAHVHGGDRALGQSDDALRHAITKLSHLHLVASEEAARRVHRLGEEKWRIVVTGAPGLDGIENDARQTGESKRSPAHRDMVLVVLHPEEANDDAEYLRSKVLLDGVVRGMRSMNARARKRSVFRDDATNHLGRLEIVWPNTDPGSGGIARAWAELERQAGPSDHDGWMDGSRVGMGSTRVRVNRHLERGAFLARMRDALVMVGNSSAGVIESGSFGVPAVDVGNRQRGRLRGKNVVHARFEAGSIARAMVRVVHGAGEVGAYRMKNPWGAGQAGQSIVESLKRVDLDRLRRKLIRY
jgi:UDP-hydrolysing UDP-N-acetyl-D-glucosamine 2-epimerase